MDLSYLAALGGVFESLRDLDYFRTWRAHAEAGTVVWANDADLAPADPLRTRGAAGQLTE